MQQRTVNKVLLISDYSRPQGGAEILTANLLHALRARGVDARLFCSSAGAVQPDSDYHCYGTTAAGRTLLQLANPAAYLRLRQVLIDFRPDVVQLQLFLTQLSPLILPLLAATPSVYYALWYRAVCPIGSKQLPDGSLCRQPAGRVCYSGGAQLMRVTYHGGRRYAGGRQRSENWSRRRCAIYVLGAPLIPAKRGLQLWRDAFRGRRRPQLSRQVWLPLLLLLGAEALGQGVGILLGEGAAMEKIIDFEAIDRRDYR